MCEEKHDSEHEEWRDDSKYDVLRHNSLVASFQTKFRVILLCENLNICVHFGEENSENLNANYKSNKRCQWLRPIEK